MKIFIKESLRDIEALGSLTFYLLATVRTLVSSNWKFFAQFIFTLVLLHFLTLMLEHVNNKKTSINSARGAALFVLINLYYNSTSFLIFSMITAVLLLYEQIKIKKYKYSQIITSLFVGLSSALTCWFLILNFT